jgi:drug/metabolite transporter (DMT)-like permease
MNYINYKNVNGIIMASVMIGLDLAFTNIALSILNIPLQQSIKAATPAITLIVESIYYKNIYHPFIYFIVLMVCTGPIIMELDSNLSTETVELWGILAMIIAVISGSLKNVFAHSIISNSKKNMGMISFTFWIELIVGFLLLPWSINTGELETLVNIDWDMYTLVILTALYGGVRILSQFYFLKYTSPTSLALTNISIQLLTTGFGIIWFGFHFSEYTITGLLISLTFSSLYVFVKMRKTCDSNYPKKCYCKNFSHEQIHFNEEIEDIVLEENIEKEKDLKKERPMHPEEIPLQRVVRIPPHNSK